MSGQDGSRGARLSSYSGFFAGAARMSARITAGTLASVARALAQSAANSRDGRLIVTLTAGSAGSSGRRPGRFGIIGGILRARAFDTTAAPAPAAPPG